MILSTVVLKMVMPSCFTSVVTFNIVAITVMKSQVNKIISYVKLKSKFLAPTGALEEVMSDLRECVCVYLMQ